MDYLSSIWLVGLISLTYVGFLFVLAIWGDRLRRPAWQPYVYSLTLAIFCTTWAFYGTVEQTVRHGWLLAPTYLGAIVLMLLGWKILDRIIQIARAENSTTISDFISARYGHSRGLAILISLLCILGIVPYIALQLKAVSGSFQMITETTSVQLSWYSDPTLFIAAVMAVFSILFGTRTVDSSESHQGMMLAIAFESLIKLVALTAVGIFAVYYLNDGFGDLFSKALADAHLHDVLTTYDNPSVYLTHALIGGIAIIALPRQFHVAVVEYRSEQDLKTARWMFPLYLLLINMFLLPLALTAYLNQDLLESFNYITLQLPMAFGQTGLALFAYIGGLSAGTSMVIIASITLATMICNEIIIPLLIKLRLQGDSRDIKERVLNIRRFAIVIVMAFAFMYYRMLSQYHSLSEIGLLSFTAIAQLAPAILIGLVWQGANRLGAYAGLITGFAIWFYCLFLPVLANAGWMDAQFMQGPFGLGFLRPQALLGFDHMNPIVHGTFWSLFFNTLALVIFSLYYKPGFSDIEQAQRFVDRSPGQRSMAPRRYVIRTDDLKALLQRFINPAKVDALFTDFANPLTGRLITRGVVSESMLKAADRLLSSVLGRRGSDLLLHNLVDDKSPQFSNLNSIMEEVSEVVLFNRDLLNSVLHSLVQGITVIDENHNLVAWNQRFANLYDFPSGYLYVGQSAEMVVRYIARSGGYGEGDVETLVQMRMSEVQHRMSLHYVRRAADGRYIELTGNPISTNLYITVYSDITEYRNIEDELRKANEILEDRVEERTQELTALNDDLQRANRNKTRFLAAAGHDLVQPLNSASLFSASIINKLNKMADRCPELASDILPVAQNMERSLSSAESLLNELLEISKLDADIVRPNMQIFSLSQVLRSLVEEFRPLFQRKGIALHFVDCHVLVESDPVLLRRILQNLLSNALRYTDQGRILVGARRSMNHVRLQIWDTGRGIPASDLNMIFEEFHRVESHKYPASKDADGKGLGLGLSIVQRMCKLLQHPIQVQSEFGRGSVFSLAIPITEQQPTETSTQPAQVSASADQLILCIDNERQITEGMSELLSDWGYQVVGALNDDDALALLNGRTPALAIVDYHLDHGRTGLDAMHALQAQWSSHVPCLVITADYTDEVKAAIQALDYQLLKKPVKAMALRAVLNQIMGVRE
ncbi:PAS domain-containing hybrid sensor histidine kinase/response regulator [Thalassolituus sp. LLYu03]|uniref:PAS domain-containing hybrid sensor histidine kinase/response regulator n=1 Tax=Thalassolituus sp. LLYu03 TaxID=3421656 RepID=UPI003D298C9A